MKLLFYNENLDSIHTLPSLRRPFLMSPQLLLFFKLPYSQLIQYSNIINHRRQEQLAVFSKSGSDIPSSPSLTPIKAPLSALFTFATPALKHILFVKPSVYINYCKIVHKRGICAASSGNCSRRRESPAFEAGQPGNTPAQPGCKVDPLRVSSLPQWHSCVTCHE